MRSSRLLFVAVAVVPAAARAQDMAADVRPLRPGTRSGEPRLNGGIALSIAQPVHEFRDYVVNGVGATGHALYRLGGAGAFALRGDFGFVNYGRESRRVPLVYGTGRVTADLSTTNNILWLGVGPQLMVPAGPVRPYVNASAGFTLFSTNSSLRQRYDDDEIASSNNKSDANWTTGLGGGVLIPFSRGARSIASVDLGARFHRNGRVQYLREGGIVDLPDGTSRLDVIESEGNLWTFHIGVAFGGR